MTAPFITAGQLRADHPYFGWVVVFKDRGDDEPVRISHMFEAHATMNEILLVLGGMDAPEVDRRLRMFAADCAARVLPIFEQHDPDDHGPYEAILVAREADCASEPPSSIAVSAVYAHSAKRHSVGHAADSALAAGFVHIADTAQCAGEAAAYAAEAKAHVEEPEDYVDAAEAEDAWQRDRLIQWFSDPEPEPIPIDHVEVATESQMC